MDYAFDRFLDETWRNIFSNMLGTNEENGDATYRLPVDVTEVENAYRIVTSLPGVSADHISISLEDDVLTISAEIPAPALANENTRTLLQERRFGQFSRSLRLPQLIDQDNVEAVYEAGVLTLTLPKLPEAQPKQIQVKAVK
jgi:HSP20 family protein